MWAENETICMQTFTSSSIVIYGSQGLVLVLLVLATFTTMIGIHSTFPLGRGVLGSLSSFPQVQQYVHQLQRSRDDVAFTIIIVSG